MDMQNVYDVVVVGGGPAGLTAAIYLARARYRVVVLEKDEFGGQINITHSVVNYPGVKETSGRALTTGMREQAAAFGAEFSLREVTGLELAPEAGGLHTVHTTGGDMQAFGVLLATGAHPRQVGFAGELDFKGRGVAYCATCDGEFFTGKQVFVVGGGFAAAEEAVFLTKYASHVTVLVREGDFTCAAATAEPVKHHPKIDVLYNVEVERVEGGAALERIVYKNRETGEVTTYEAPAGDTFGVFVFAGYEPETSLVKGVIELDDHGYVLANHDQSTCVPGLYAAGDVCQKPLRQVVTATGDGALAATALEVYVASCQRATGIVPQQPATAAAPARKPAGSGAAAPVAAAAPAAGGALAWLDPAMRQQLDAVFERMARPLVLALELDGSDAARELEAWMEELATLTPKLSVTRTSVPAGTAGAPSVAVCDEAGTPTGLGFHGVPGGHEFTSFILGLYNAAGPGQPLEDAARARIAAISEPVRLQILVSLSCTNCPDTVLAAQRIASLSPYVTAEAYDINHNGELKDAHNVMSVPCIIKNGEELAFGKKNVNQVLDFIGM
jgi:thioredoxin reductase (NADPH)